MSLNVSIKKMILQVLPWPMLQFHGFCAIPLKGRQTNKQPEPKDDLLGRDKKETQFKMHSPRFYSCGTKAKEIQNLKILN